MKHLIIRNIGPIKEVDIELKRFNLLIGLQSSGKSTINKIACYCSWVEKEICSTQSPAYFEKKDTFENRLVVFHKLEGFIHPDAYIEYETDVMHFTFSKKEEKFHFEWKDRWSYIRPKTIYIPSERNIVASIPNWFDVKLEENNIRSFMSDWEEARNYYANKPIKILNLGVEYSYEKTNQHDSVWLNGNKSIDFTNVSSGLQSLIPLLVILQYVTEGVYYGEKKESIKYNSGIEALVRYIQHSISEKSPNTKIERIKDENGNIKLNYIFKGGGFSLAKINDYILTFASQDEVEKAQNIFNNYFYPHYTNIFLEEPEQNLYPTTQRDLIYRIAELSNNERKHNVFITTHSPYILTSLNNLLFSAQVGERRKEEARKIIPMKYWIQYDDIGAWFVKNGKISSILDKELKQIKAEKIDEVSRYLNRDFDKLFELEYEDE